MSIEKTGGDYTPWIQEQIRAELPILKDQNTKEEIKNLSLETLISFFEKNKDTTFSKEQKTPDNSAAHIIAYQKALNLLGIQIAMDGMYGDKTTAALQKFQKNKGLKSQNGVPGPETTRALLAELKVLNEKKREEKNKLNEKGKPDEKEKNSVVTIIENAKKSSILSPLSKNGSFYNGNSAMIIDYAVLKQPDGESYLYDIPMNGVRTVYRISINNEILSIGTISNTGILVMIRGETMKDLKYQPFLMKK